jgi:hypothetical protein
MKTNQESFSRWALILAGLLAFATAVFQFALTFAPSWSLYLGAPEFIIFNVVLRYAVSFTAAVVFAVFGLYAFSGAGIVGRPPLLRWVLLAIAVIFTIRGLIVIPLVLNPTASTQYLIEPAPQHVVSSLVALFIGVVYLIGVVGRWPELKS